MTHTTEQERADFLQMHADFEREFGPMPQDCKWSGRGFYQTSHHAWQAQEYANKFDGFKAAWKAAHRAPSVPETIEQRAKKLKGLQVLIGATAGVPEAIELARSRFTEAYGRSPLHDDLAYACLLIDAYGGAPSVPVQLRRPTLEEIEEVVGYHSSGWDCIDPSELIDAIMNIATAPQPPEAAPVELPEPVYTMRVRGRMHDYTPTLSAFDLADGEHKLYTEQQVRALLEAKASVSNGTLSDVCQRENLREGEPYDNPAFEALARALGVWGTAQSAVCAQFWIAAKEQSA